MVSSFLAGIKTVCWWAAVEIALRKTSVMDLERFILVRIQLRIFPKLNPFLIKRVNLEIINNYALNSIKRTIYQPTVVAIFYFTLQSYSA